MTTTGGWPPPDQRPPHPGAPPWGAPQQAGPAFPPARDGRDGTARVIGTIALVVAGCSLLAQLMMIVLPSLLLAPFLFAGGGWEGEGPVPQTTAGFVGGVALDPDGSVDGATLRQAVARHGARSGALALPASAIRCDDVERATPETSALCRGADGEEWYAVVRFTDGGGSFVVVVLTDFEDVW